MRGKCSVAADPETDLPATIYRLKVIQVLKPVNVMNIASENSTNASPEKKQKQNKNSLNIMPARQKQKSFTLTSILPPNLHDKILPGQI